MLLYSLLEFFSNFCKIYISSSGFYKIYTSSPNFYKICISLLHCPYLGFGFLLTFLDFVCSLFLLLVFLGFNC